MSRHIHIHLHDAALLRAKTRDAKYRVIVPYQPSMGSISPFIVSGSSYKEDALWELNSMRRHDGLTEWTQLPPGVRFERVQDSRDQKSARDAQVPAHIQSRAARMDPRPTPEQVAHYAKYLRWGTPELAAAWKRAEPPTGRHGIPAGAKSPDRFEHLHK